MAEHYLGKLKVDNADFVEIGGTPALEQYDALYRLLSERAGPEVAALFAEPLISRGNDAAPPTVSWYGESDGRPLESLSGAERARAEAYLADHLRPVRALAEEPGGALAMAALTVYGAEDVMVVGDRPVIVNWGLMPGGKGASVATRPAHYAKTLGKFVPMEAAARPVAEPPKATPAAAAAAPVTRVETRRVVTPLAWVPLLILLLLAGGTLAWLLTPGVRLFADDTAPAVTDEALLAATRAETEALNARRDQLEAALAGAVCRADGQLILPGGLTPEGLLPPEPGVQPAERAEAAPDAILPSRSSRVVMPDETSLLARIEASTVMVLASGAGPVSTGSGFVIGPGLIVTNHHVVENALDGAGQVLVTGGALGAPQPAEIVKTQGPLAETGGDFALLRIAETSLPALSVYLPEGSLVLNNVVAAGYPGDVLETDAGFAALRGGDLSAVPGLTVTDGIVNTEQQLSPTTHVLLHSAALSSGNSGGPLLDMCGRLVGVNAFVRQGVMQNRGFALTTGDLMAFLNGTGAAPTVVSDSCAPVVARPDVAIGE